MVLFSYIGLDARGVEQQGQLEAESKKEVARILRERSILLLEVREGVGAGLNGGIRSSIRVIGGFLQPHRYTPVGAGDLVMFFRQTALMLRAGFTLVKVLDANCEMVAKHGLRLAIKRMSHEIRRGVSFSSVIAREKKIFSPMISNLIASGEESGDLESILDRLADSLEQSKELKRQLVAAMIYPTIVLLSAIGVVVFMVRGVIPRLGAFLTARHKSLPASTQLLLDISDWAVDWGGLLAIALGIGTFGVLAAYTTRPGKRVVDRCILALPVVGKAVLFAAMAQAGWSLSMLLKSGVTALESLRITSGVIGNLAIRDCFQNAADGLLVGRPLSKTFEQPHIPLMMRHMAAVGESSGQLDVVMHDAGEYYRKELAAKVKIIAALVEPVLIIVVGSMVGFVYFSLFQAVMSASKGGL